jgi:hypothetical protein
MEKPWSFGRVSKKIGIFLQAAAILGFMTCIVGEARATTFGFQDEYYVNTQTEFNTLFGAGTAGYSTPGVYQKTNSTTPTVVQLSAHGTGEQQVTGEFIQNGTPNVNAGIALSGWGKTGANGGVVGSVYTQGTFQNTLSGFQYKTGITTSSLSGGTATAFNLNSIDLVTSDQYTSTGYTIRGLLNGVVVDQENVSTNFYGNTVNSVTTSGPTLAFNWTDIDTVLFGYFNGTSFVAWPNDGVLFMDNINIDPYSAPIPTPEPCTMLLLGSGFLGFGAYGKRRKNKLAA